MLSITSNASQGKLKTLSNIAYIIDSKNMKPILQSYIKINVDDTQINYESIYYNDNEKYLNYIVTGAYLDDNKNIIINIVDRDFMDNINEE